MELTDLNITVVGSGPGGAVAALLLANARANVTLIERVANPSAVGAGISIAENGRAVLAGLGLEAALVRAGRQLDATSVVDGRGRKLLGWPSDSPLLMVRRSTLTEVLIEAIERQPRIRRRFGCEAVSAKPDGTLTIEPSGPDGKAAEQLRADLIVGADGLHSKIREAAAVGAWISRSGIAYVRGLVREGLARSEEAWTGVGLFGSYDVGELTYFYASAGTRAMRKLLDSKDLDGWRKAWAKAYAAAQPIVEAVAKIDDLLINDVRRVRCKRFFDGKIVLIGDAAHAMPPNLGQGANSSFVDGAVLVDELRRAANLSTALAAYDKRRRSKVDRVASASAMIGAVAETTNGFLRWIRDRIVLPLIGGFKPSPGFIMQEPRALLEQIARTGRDEAIPPPASALKNDARSLEREAE